MNYFTKTIFYIYHYCFLIKIAFRSENIYFHASDFLNVFFWVKGKFMSRVSKAYQAGAELEIHKTIRERPIFL